MSDTIKRETIFIKSASGEFFLPRPTSVIAGGLLHAWFKHLVGEEAKIASPSYWENLCENNNVSRLVEYADGRHEIIDEAR
tara:strand:- start:17113 stop:17355 length:243 start_codon:yes stop_codon:yes gene_type:complete